MKGSMKYETTKIWKNYITNIALFAVVKHKLGWAYMVIRRIIE